MGEGSETFNAREATYGVSPSCSARMNAGRCYPHPASATLADLSLVRERCKRSARDAFRYLLFLVALGAREVVLNDRPWIVQAPIVRRDASLVPNRDEAIIAACLIPSGPTPLWFGSSTTTCFDNSFLHCARSSNSCCDIHS